MGPIKEKLAVWAKDKALVRCVAAVSGALLLLLVLTCISIHMRSHIQGKYSSLVAQIEDQTYASLSQMSELFSRVDDPQVDVRHKLIPELKAQYTAARALNSTLGERAPLNGELVAGLDAAFEQYSKAYRQGSATGLAKADMAECMLEVQALLDAHYAPPKEEQPVVVIDASSGKIAKD